MNRCCQGLVGAVVAVVALAGCESDCERLCEDEELQAQLDNAGVEVDCSDEAFIEAESCAACLDVFLDYGISVVPFSPGDSICDEYF